MRRVRSHGMASAPFSFNATPMVDVIFLLTIFFMLITRFSSAEQIPMELPKPEHSQAKVTRMPQRVVINCRLAGLEGPGALATYSLGPNRPESLAVISDRLAAMKQESPNLEVVVRADRRLPYGQVRAVMKEIARQGIEMMNIVAHVGEDE